MKAKEKKTEKMVKVSQSGLMSLVAYIIKDKVLFSEKVERINRHLNNVEVI